MSRKKEPQSPDPRAAKYEQVFEKIYRIVLKIPRGRVMTYGQIARLLDDRYSPRLVGWAMHATPNASMAALAQRCGNVMRLRRKSVHSCPIIAARS